MKPADDSAIQQQRLDPPVDSVGDTATSSSADTAGLSPPEVARDEPPIIMASIVSGANVWRHVNGTGDPFRPIPAAQPLLSSTLSSSRSSLPFSIWAEAARPHDYLLALFSRRAQAALFEGRPVAKIYSVPRRFDLSTLFVVSTAFAAMFALLGYLDFSSAAKLACCAFFSGVGLAQAVLYGSRAPRLSSVLAGGMLLSILPIMFYPPRNPASLVCTIAGLGILGPPSGYIAGTIVGGIFLVADNLRNWIARRASRNSIPQSYESPIIG